MMTNSHVQAGAAFNHGLPSIRSIAVPKLPFHRGSGPDESLTLSNFQNKIPAAKSTRPRFFKMTEDKHKKVDVVIIGAGAAGLQTASNLLASSNFNGVTTERPSFLILEGRNRVGGRICTAVESKTKLGGNEKVSFPRDLGAAWVHGTGLGDEDVEDQNPMIKLLEKTTPEGQSVLEYHLNPIFQGNCWTRPDTVLHKAGRIALFRKGERIRNDSPLVKVSIERHYQIEKEIAKRGSQLYEIGQELLTAMTPVAQVRSRVSKLLEAEEKEDSSLVGDLVPFYAFLSENWNGISEDDLQLSWFELPDEPMNTDELYIDEGDYPGVHAKLHHGMEKVIEPLYDQVADRIILDQKVVKIARLGTEEVRVQTESGMTVDAKCCISTIPVGCLQRDVGTMFDPPLSTETVEAIHSLATGHYKKVFLTFDDIFWPIEEPVLGLVRTADQADELGQYLLVYNFLAKDSIPCLEAILVGNSGKWSVSKSDAEIRDAVLTFIEDAMAVEDLASKCVSCHITRWEEDPFTLGAYSSFKLGTLDRHMDELIEPKWDGDLIIAGEFTESDDMGSVHAALYSGDRAAAQALETLSRKRAQSMNGEEKRSDMVAGVSGSAEDDREQLVA